MDERLKIYADRLFEEWKLYSKIIIGVDYDTTIFPYGLLNNREDILRCISVIKACKETGCHLIIHTSCNDDRIPEIREYCKKTGIIFDRVNMTPIELPYGRYGSKPYCNIYIDDRGALPSSLDILENALYRYRAYQQEKLNNTDVA